MDDTHPFQVIHHLLEQIAVGLSPSLEVGVSLVPKGGIRRRKCLHLIQHHPLVTVEEKPGGDFVGVQGGDNLLNDLDIGYGADDDGGVIGIDKAVGAQPFGVLHQQLHRLLPGRAFFAFQHLLFVPG
jgi:hypothetical protein